LLRRNILLLLTIISIIAFFGTSCGRRSRPTSESRIIVIPEGRISGAFIQFPLPYATSDWEQELSFMQAIGFDTMVIQCSHYSDRCGKEEDESIFGVGYDFHMVERRV